jgi:tetratricopeptide (TPR) repeat protein
MHKRIDAWLADDRVDAAAAGMRALLATPPSNDEPLLAHRVTMALRLAALGRVLNKPAWSRLGLDFTKRAVNLPPSPEGPSRLNALPLLLAELRLQGMAESAQALALSELERQRASSGGMGALMVDPAQRQALIELVALYDAAGRPADVRRMLDDVPAWAASDLGEIADAKDSLGAPIGLMAARALKAGGDVASAIALARAVVARLPGHDPAYQLWIELAGEAAVPELDRLAAADPFEERPLVWKAVALSRAGQHAAAEESVRRAIAIDPSDGEQGVNDRLRAYAVLADVLQAKGDAKAALGYRRAVAAIRMSERADELLKLGLYQRAFAGYRAALAEFSDAYCIQSRLAVQLGKLGFHDEALKHYRRAFELMPDSFGRVESHCLGCESVFAGANSQAVAEEVFGGLLEADTTKPQVPYMLGYLRKTQGRYDEAVVLFRRAIALDAQYLNAWRQLSELSEKTYVDPAERDIARLRLFELDPHRRHVRYELDAVGDLPSLWRAVAGFDAARANVAKPQPAYPLAASARAQHDALARMSPEERRYAEIYAAAQNRVPGSRWDGRPPFNLAQHRLLGAVVKLMEDARAAASR